MSGTFQPPSDQAYVPPPAPLPEQAKKANPWRTVAIVIAAAVAVGSWSTGQFDEPLSSVGLNRYPCAKNLFGNTLCGDDLKAWCKVVYSDSNRDVCDKVLDRDERPSL